MADDRFLLRIPGIARFLLTAGRDIAFEPEDGVSPGEIAIFVIGTVFGILLHQRRRIVLHASAVCVNGRAVLFCGQSGAGKSTIAAALGQRGYDLLSDDVCAISLDGGAPMVHPDGRQLKLWAQAIERLDLVAQRGERVRTRLEKFYVAPGTVSEASMPVGLVYVLRETRPPYETGIEAPNVVDAALLLRRNAYRPLLVNRMDQKADYFFAATAIANAAGIFFLSRKLDFAQMPEVLSRLEAHWQQTGLTETAA
jgi:hypothetical protein